MRLTICMLLISAWTTAYAARPIRLISPEIWELGRLREGTVVTDTIRFINASTSAIHIKDIKTSCGCTIPKYDKTALSPGDTAQVMFMLKTQGFHGLLRKDLTVYFQEPAIQPVTFMLEFSVFTDLDITPMYIQFKNVRVNPDTLITAFITVRNYSEQRIRLGRIYAKAKQVTVKPSRARLNPQDEVTIEISMRPEKTMMLMDYIIIETDYDKKPVMEIPVFSQIQK